MPNIRDIKRRIQAIHNIQHVTGAMKMVAASKLRRAQSQVWAARPYAYKIAEVVGRLALAPQAREIPLVAPREVSRVGYVLVTGDRGLCGAYNANLISLAVESLNQEKRSAALIPVGSKGARYFLKRPVEILKYYEDVGDDFDLARARNLARQLMDYYLKLELDEVHLIYARFHTALRHELLVERFLPVVTPTLKAGEEVDYIYEPEPRSMLEAILPRYCEMRVFQALLEAKASEHSARMVAMESATSNAGDVIDRLTLTFNKARQAAITKEIVEIATGAEALKARS
ncbi:MAG: ATP synthase F1 subunit gamma [Firmicutes bacterium]|nr:ATP synthase F1 subunit gamma [Bacillota bacterium]